MKNRNKNTWYLHPILYFLIASLVLSYACQRMDENQIPSKPMTSPLNKEIKPDEQISKKNQEISTKKVWHLLKGKSPKYTVQTKQYRYKKIDIRYPLIIGKQKTKVNDLIKNSIFKMIQNDYGKKYKEKKNFELIIDYKIELQNSKFISIFFSGYSNEKGTAHPNDFIYTLNVDLQKIELCQLTDFYNINNEFIEILDSNFKNQYTEDYWEALDWMYSGKDLEKQLKRADTIKKYVLCRSYFTKKDVVIIFEVPRAIGSQILIKIKHKDLPKNK